jgi:hypothetical protein
MVKGKSTQLIGYRFCVGTSIGLQFVRPDIMQSSR